MKIQQQEAQEWMELALSQAMAKDPEDIQMGTLDKLLQEAAESMPVVKMEAGSFERIWDNVKATL